MGWGEVFEKGKVIGRLLFIGKGNVGTGCKTRGGKYRERGRRGGGGGANKVIERVQRQKDREREKKSVESDRVLQLKGL